MTKISSEKVKKVADLIKLHLSNKEIDSLKNQLNTVIDSMDILNELDTENIEPTYQTHGLINVYEEDEVNEGLNIEDYPNKKNLKKKYFTVKRVINN